MPLRHIERRFSAYSSPVMLISRKMTQDKRVVMDLRHLNTRTAKNNLAYQFIKDTFAMLGNYKCDVLSVLDLKDAFYSLQLSENSKNYWKCIIFIPKNAYGTPPIWQTYINTILNCLEGRKYCEAVMDDLLLFTPSKQSHMTKLEDLLKALLQEWT